jgi:hypothetical protein
MAELAGDGIPSACGSVGKVTAHRLDRARLKGRAVDSTPPHMNRFVGSRLAHARDVQGGGEGGFDGGVDQGEVAPRDQLGDRGVRFDAAIEPHREPPEGSHVFGGDDPNAPARDRNHGAGSDAVVGGSARDHDDRAVTGTARRLRCGRERGHGRRHQRDDARDDESKTGASAGRRAHA